MKALTLSIPILGLLSACSSKPVVSMDNVNPTLTPTQARSQFDQYQGVNVAWGGMIINTRNLAEQTQIEILAFPLDEEAEPKRSASPLERFVLRHDGYLEPAQYAQGRWITVRGKLLEVKAGKIGETDYQYPVIQSEQLHLWPKETAPAESSTRFHFGIGVTIGN